MSNSNVNLCRQLKMPDAPDARLRARKSQMDINVQLRSAAALLQQSGYIFAKANRTDRLPIANDLHVEGGSDAADEGGNFRAEPFCRA
jgi:hypothetical protein